MPLTSNIMRGNADRDDPACRLTFLVHRGMAYTLRHYFRTWGTSVANCVDVKTYPGIGNTGRTLTKRLERRWKGWRTGTLRVNHEPPTPQIYVFTDLEILTQLEIESTAALYRRLVELPWTNLILNNPRSSLTRRDLIRALKNDGLNSYDARPAESACDWQHRCQYPVFTRDDRSHDDANISELFYDANELAEHLREFAMKRNSLRHRTVIEFAGSPGPDGLFRKYGAVRLQDAIVPCHIFFGREWKVKHASIVDQSTIREELEYIETNPHRDSLRRVFERARIDYGRVDYGVSEGQINVWEINTNPYLIRPQYTQQKERHAVLSAFSSRFNEAIRKIVSLN